MTRRPLLGPGAVVRATRPYAAVDPALSGDAVRAAVIRLVVARWYARKRRRMLWCRR